MYVFRHKPLENQVSCINIYVQYLRGELGLGVDNESHYLIITL